MKYRHYKGGIYEIVCEAKLESDPSVTMMVYKNEAGAIWTRPKDVFFELVECEGKTVPRFAPLDSATHQDQALKSFHEPTLNESTGQQTAA